MHSASRAIRHSLGQLVSILLEVTWRCDSCSIIPVTPVTESVVAIATELCVHLKDCDPQDCLQLLQDLPSPWPRMVICSFIFQDIAHISNQEITLGDILDYSYAVGVSQEAENKQSTPIKQNLLHCKEHSSFVSTKSWSSASSRKTRKTRFSAKIINKKNPLGETPLIRACIKNNVDRMLDLLAVPGIDINLSDNLGWTALHEAAIRGYDECVKMLLTYNCSDNLGQKNSLYSYVRRVRHTHTLNTHARGGEDKRTPLHDAVQYNHFSTVKLLLDYGGAGLLKLETKDGKTPRDFASNNEMRHLLRSYQEKSPISIAQGDENYQTYIKLPIISCGLNIPNRFFSSHDSHMNFIVTFANCFMEVSGSRFIQIAIEKELYKAQKRRLAEEKCLESDTSSAGEATADNRTQGSSYIRTIPLFSQIKPPSDLESALINKIFQSVKLNILMCQEQKKRQLSAEEKSDFLERLQLLFS
ncbi:uncharacterized protein LOC121864621 [Homarus americanus]|uniref:uncharacterized protein LOC121864621 n=1 Tax=Homarus americanus TaxID=6706 RepID=UPI001C45CF0F|nr:uncharacterized protein LOC121864621 [Homarus americanus]